MDHFIEEFIHLATDPAHLAVEFCFVLLDVLVISVIVNRVKKHFHKDISDEHAKIEREHGLRHPMSPAEASRIERDADVILRAAPYDYEKSGS